MKWSVLGIVLLTSSISFHHTSFVPNVLLGYRWGPPCLHPIRSRQAHDEWGHLVQTRIARWSTCSAAHHHIPKTCVLYSSSSFFSTSLDWISEWVSVQTASHSQHFYVWLAKWIMDKLGLFRSLRWNSSIKTLANIRLCHLGFQWMPKLLPLHSCCTHCKQELRFLQLSVELVFRRLRIINQLTRMPSVPCEIDIFFLRVGYLIGMSKVSHKCQMVTQEIATLLHKNN